MATLRETFKDIADAIREKGVSGTFKPIEMAEKIGEISGGGGEDYGYLTFTAQQASTLKMGMQGSVPGGYPKLLKSNDAVNWGSWDNPNTNTISLSSGQSVYIKAADDASYRTATSTSIYNKLVMTGKIKVSGDIRSIVKLVAPADYAQWLAYLFYQCTALVQAPELPATTLANYCYYYMFCSCSSLTQAPELPATNLAIYCYSSMFRSCSSLVQAPELPATTLTERCYSNMFDGCTSLTQAPELPATTLVAYCYTSMFSGCTSLRSAPQILPATTLANQCCNGMFSGCTSLTQAPELPAKTMATNCYSYMFRGCTSLKRVKMNASSSNWGTNMFDGCTSLELVDMTGSTGVPQLSNVNNFASTNDTYKIVVPDSLYDTWIAATNWSSASIKPHIMKQSDWNSTHPDDQL